MTGYHLRIGYLSAADKHDAWLILKEIVAALCASPERIAAEAVRFGMTESIATGYAEAYRSFSPKAGRTEDSTLVIKEKDPNNEDDEPQVMQLASGGGAARGYKEAIRRAFCRLVIYEMHKRELEVDLGVG